ncbi:MAG: DUF5011 domain-containing protein [Bacilli bacterium]|nr:DUF5011 domain-containing protein [Bacilli bacterium]
MKKKLLFFSILTLLSLFSIKDTYAYDKSTYASRKLCGTYELALFKSDGSIEKVSCHDTYDKANAAMKADGRKDLAVLGTQSGKVKIFNAMSALVDLTHPSGTFDIFDSASLSNAHTYMVGESGYGGVDAALLSITYSSKAGTFVMKIKINGYKGWVKLSAHEIVPLVWVKSSSSYTVSDSSIRHNYVNKIQNTYSGSQGSTIGPKPEMLSKGTYYSYDGHYFYKDRYTMVTDYKNNTYANSVNPDKPYYNYYQFLPQHTRTTYSSINIDEYVRTSLKKGRDVYGTASATHQNINSSRLYGKGAFFYNAQELYGANALLSFGVSRNESGNGTSNLSINKNNGFGLNAVDSNPTQAANWFPTFAQSIYDYSNSWVTYGYSNPEDWRYFGSQNGDKRVGMNVKYASDVYWGEKMASNYYFLDKAYGLQDYNFYQTGITTRSTAAKAAPKTSAKSVFTYPSSEVGLVLLEEVEGEEVNGNKIWYKVVSDMNIDANFNKKTSGYYNWDSYVYIPAAYVLKTNTGENGYISPNDVPEHKDKNYTYDLYIKNATIKPKVAVSVKDTPYYYDPTLISKKGQTLLNNRYVMVFTTAYDENKKPVAYLVTSDYKYDQKHWVSADSIKFITSAYGQASVTVDGVNTYTIVTPTTIDKLDGHISGLYHYAYTPILEEKTVSGELWYKVPVNLSGSSNIYGWTLAKAPDVKITKYNYYAENQAPVINAKDKTITQGKEFKELEGVTATDAEDGSITGKVTVKENTVKTDTPGTYKVTYEVTDNNNHTTTKIITVTVVEDEKPVINANDKKVNIGSTFNELNGVTATDKEDGDITKNIKVIKNTVNTEELGTYEVTYQVTDSYNHTVEKTIKISVEEIVKEETKGLFNLNYIKTKDNKLLIQGYEAIYGIDNNLNIDINYTLIFLNIDTNEEIKVEGTRITKKEDIPKSVYSPDGKDYTYSWFNAEVDVDNLPVGNYQFYAYAETDLYYVKELVNNNSYKPQSTKVESATNEATISNNYDSSTSYVELKVRDEAIADKNSSYIYNQYTKYTKFEFSDDYLYIRGNSYSYGMDLSKSINVIRNIVFENKSTYKKYTKSLDSIIDGNYQVFLPVDDKLDKTKAWFDKKIDISDIPVGEYVIYITTSSNITDYSEFTEKLGRSLEPVKKTINNKNYSFSINLSKGNRIEMKVTN